MYVKVNGITTFNVLNCYTKVIQKVFLGLQLGSASIFCQKEIYKSKIEYRWLSYCRNLEGSKF